MNCLEKDVKPENGAALLRRRSRWTLAAWCALGIFCFGAGPIVEVGAADAADAADATTGADGTADPSGDEGRRRTILDTLMDAGIVGLTIFLLSMVAVAFVIEHFITIRKERLMPAEVLDHLEQLIARRRVDEALRYCYQEQDFSMVSGIVLAGLERYKGAKFGFAEYKSAVEEAGEDQTGRLYRKTEVLGLIGAIAPMLGLTGTVLGMIGAFNTIADTGGMARPDQLAGNIGQALVTTLMGLLVAIPAMIAFSFFRNRIDSIVAEAGKRIERVMMPLGGQQQR